MKRIALVIVCLAAAAVGAWYRTHPGEFVRHVQAAKGAAERAWANAEANPVPVVFALGTFLATVAYHTAKGKSLRESVEVAATRVTVVPVPREPDEAEALVVKRAKARATRAQLLADQIALQNRQRKMPEAVLKAEKDACYTEQSVADAERALADKEKSHVEAVVRLEALRKDKAACDAELAAIDAELTKLAEWV